VAVGDASAFSEAQRRWDATGKPGDRLVSWTCTVHSIQPVCDVSTKDSWFEGHSGGGLGGTATVVDFALPRPD